ncbi:scoloptoxin SSD346-like isoform X2 [Anopheles merus]|uniref:scoloptoxin SSD346-like isoform X2 n=1 Tax=Anopheles merus TaxID=30066 RepID=UPI001BE4639D|nr:scoloptoxin SSD346-like isoform X2 [Anopheles merus]
MPQVRTDPSERGKHQELHDGTQWIAEQGRNGSPAAGDGYAVSGNPSFPIGQNVFFHPKPILQHWEALALSTWFAEKDRPGSSNLSVGRLQSAGVSNYTQLIWARTQFVGCGAASMYGGHLIVCYYHPRGNVIGQPVYTVGRRACTGCPQERAACSHVFRGLCGIDDKHSAGQRPYAHNALLVMMFIATVWSKGSIGWRSERT